MRPLEIVLLVALLPVLLAYFVPRARRPGWLRFVTWMALGLMLVQLIVEKYRWQMVPAYVLVVLSCLLALRKAPDAAPVAWWRTAVRITGAVVALLLFAVTVCLAWAFPMFQDPATTGPYTVGTTRLFFVDSSREDPFAPTPHTPRELLAAVWYPAEVAADATPLPFWPKDSAAGSALTQLLHTPGLVFSHVRLVKSHSYQDPPVARAEQQYPVLIFSHGYSGTIWQNTPQMEELASHGFIVLSLGHTYESGAVPFPDGRVVFMSQARMATLMKSAAGPEMATLFKQMQASNDPAEIKRLSARLVELGGPMNDSLDLWVADTRYLMDELEKINAGSNAGVTGPAQRFTGHLDVSRFGIFGMSYGGATAGEVCLHDPRCKAGLNYDGGQFGDVKGHPLPRPFLYFSSEGNKMNDPIYEGSNADLYSVHVKRSTHLDFTDLSMAMPGFKYLSMQGVSLLGPIEADRIEHIMNAYTVAFFAKYLQGQIKQPLLDAPTAEFPDVVFTAHPAPPGQSPSTATAAAK